MFHLQIQPRDRSYTEQSQTHQGSAFLFEEQRNHAFGSIELPFHDSQSEGRVSQPNLRLNQRNRNQKRRMALRVNVDFRHL